MIETKDLEIEDVVFEIADRLDALIEVLIDKKIFSLEEFDIKLKKIEEKSQIL